MANGFCGVENLTRLAMGDVEQVESDEEVVCRRVVFLALLVVILVLSAAGEITRIITGDFHRPGAIAVHDERIFPWLTVHYWGAPHGRLLE